MTSSPQDLPPWLGSWPTQWDRDQTRDRLRDLEHVTEHLTDAHDKTTARLDGLDTEMGWVKAAIGLLTWVLFNGKLATWTPEAAAFVASLLKGLAR